MRTRQRAQAAALATIVAMILSGCSEGAFQGASGTKKKSEESDDPVSPTDDDTDDDDDLGSNDADDDDDDGGSDADDDDSDTALTPGVDGDCATKTNLTTNSDFESGNVGFQSYYTFDDSCRGTHSPGGSSQYSINATPKQCHNGYEDSAGDSGKMLVVNMPAAGQQEKRFWCQTLKVEAGKYYKISARLRAAVPSAVDTQPTEVAFTINGNEVMATFRLEKDWKTHRAVEIPAASGDIVLCGESRTQNVESTDLIADDFKFAECKD